MTSVKCFEHFFECSPTDELAAFKLVAKFVKESNLRGIGIFMCSITVITLNKFGKPARGCCGQVFLASDINSSGLYIANISTSG